MSNAETNSDHAKHFPTLFCPGWNLRMPKTATHLELFACLVGFRQALRLLPSLSHAPGWDKPFAYGVSFSVTLPGLMAAPCRGRVTILLYLDGIVGIVAHWRSSSVV
jgi:hypothetical protein